MPAKNRYRHISKLFSGTRQILFHIRFLATNADTNLIYPLIPGKRYSLPTEPHNFPKLNF